MMTCDTPNSRSIGALISPVNAPSNSQCIVCAPRRTRVSRSSWEAAGIEQNGGATTISTYSASAWALGRKTSRYACVSAAVLCIFQLAAKTVLVFKCGDSGKYFSFEILERRAAAGRYVRHFGGKAEHVRGGGRVAAADDAGCAGGGRASDRVAHGLRSVAIGRLFVNAHRSVEDDRLRAFDRCGIRLRGRRTDVENHLVADRAYRDDVREVLRVDCRSNDHVGWKLEIDLALSREVENLPSRHEIVVSQRSSDVDAAGREQRVCHSAADAERVDELREVGQNPDLVLDLCAADHADERFGGVFD